MVSLAVSLTPLARAMTYSIPNVAVYDNISEYDVALSALMSANVYVEREVAVEAIQLCELEEVQVFGAFHYIALTRDGAIAEYIPPAEDPQELLQKAVQTPAQFEVVDGETVIVTRFGWSTWGHWLGELLPQIVMVERMCPGRFSYAVARAYEEVPWRSYAESIASYGIAPQRLVLVDERKTYCFRNAWGVTSVWSNAMMHPVAAETMRCMLRLRKAEPSSTRIALLRKGEDARSIENWADLASLFTKMDYTFLDISAMHFWHQASAFIGADTVFSVLGSGLTGLIYSPLGVRILSVAPGLFADRFFYALAVDRRGRYADVRGSIVKSDPTIPHRGSFQIDLDRIRSGLLALD